MKSLTPAHWPPGLPQHLTLPQTHVFYNLEVSARRYPDKPFIVFYDSVLTYADFLRETEHLAGHLQQAAGVQPGDRVLLCMQNSPQWALAFYAILRAGAVVVPVNPMNRVEELRHCVSDSGAQAALVAQDLLPQVRPLIVSEGEGLRHVIVGTYSDHLRVPTDLAVPDFVAAPRQPLNEPGLVTWADAIAAERTPGPLTTGPDDLCAMPYT
ncbi:MAG: AMP-binding protein, partial [Hydrogenophaga sp.]|nr:AMP-binding protein [Hydrogenophaga sp.]